MTPIRHVPLKKPRPDAQRFTDVVLGRRRDTVPPLVEYIIDDVVMAPIVRDLLRREWVVPTADRATLRSWADSFIEFWYRLGYDFVRLEIGLSFSAKRLLAKDPAPRSNKDRAWNDQHHGCISTWAEFERYPWPKAEETDFFVLEYINDHLPEGMGFITCHAGGPFEHLSSIMSIEKLCLALLEDPELVQAVSDRIGAAMTAFYRHILQLSRLVAIFQGDDLGFRTSTLVAPDSLRRYVLPWHKRFAAMAHERGLPYFLHSCGNVEPIMEDLITEVRIDAKHSFEDAIVPVQEFQTRYGDRIGVLGGLDVNILSGATPEEVRRQTRRLVETCGPRGRYAIGSGNSVPSYVPVDNYLAMMDEAVGFGTQPWM